MKPCESFRDNIEVPLVVVTAASDQDPARFVLPVDFEVLDQELPTKFCLPMLVGAALFTSGMFHLILLCVTGADWSGPLSLRKSALFGISAGLTVWSIAWILTQLAPRRGDQRLASLLSGGLLLEVGLITLQQWRGVSSHFNRTTPLNSLIETIMLGLILLATAGIAWLCWRSRWLRPMAESQAIAIRAGLFLLLLSCGLGMLVTIAGEINLAQGRPPEIWGLAGVLKYPHGAVLHAVQTLPFLSFLMQKFRVRRSAWLMRSAVAAHLLFLGHAMWQTFLGRARMDVDVTSVTFLAASALLLLLPIVAILYGAVAIARASRSANA
ncbi:MAG: hypothetical protein WCJ09_28040 [Planctomycetota bacterium]